METRKLPDELFLRASYRTFLRREPDELGSNHYLQALRSQRVKRWKVVNSIIRSPEFRQGNILEALHRARVMVVSTCLPPAQVVVDLGGAANGRPEGALLFMGYPHRPAQITIVDLPPSQRFNWTADPEPSQDFVTPAGVRVRYLYGSMADLSLISDTSVDLVWCGESIEHVTEEEADAVCRQAYRVLRPGGYFCLDTPNASLTRLQSPEAFIHPEHKKEYHVAELRAKLEAAGLQVLEAKGVCPMPKSLQEGVFKAGELVRNIALSEVPEQGYLFYLKAVRPVRKTRPAASSGAVRMNTLSSPEGWPKTAKYWSRKPRLIG